MKFYLTQAGKHTQGSLLGNPCLPKFIRTRRQAIGNRIHGQTHRLLGVGAKIYQQDSQPVVSQRVSLAHNRGNFQGSVLSRSGGNRQHALDPLFHREFSRAVLVASPVFRETTRTPKERNWVVQSESCAANRLRPIRGRCRLSRSGWPAAVASGRRPENRGRNSSEPPRDCEGNGLDRLKAHGSDATGKLTIRPPQRTVRASAQVKKSSPSETSHGYTG